MEETTLDSLENFVFKEEYLDEAGCSWGDWHNEKWDGTIDFLQGRVLGFCCCGEPKKMLFEICEYLESPKIDRDDWSNSMLMCYYVNSVGLLEHGGSVECGWLTEKGKRFIKIVNELKEKLNAETKGEWWNPFWICR